MSEESKQEEFIQDDLSQEEEKDNQEKETFVEEDQDDATLAKETERLKDEVEEWKNKALRTQADMENMRRRHREEREKDAKYRAQDLIESLLPVLDNFERALNIQPESDEASSLLEGVNMVYSQLFDALSKEGVEAIEAEGEPFDPHLHQAVMQVEEDGFESNQIVEELQKGYKLKDKVIRPAMVKVNA